MDIKYFLCNPTGNITALVETPVEIENQPQVGNAIMEAEISCEQVGFIMSPVEGSDITLRMAGGEFCGNATMSIAAFFCKKNNLSDGESRNVAVKVIGTSGLVNVLVENKGGIHYGTIEMPRPRKISSVKFVFEDHNYWYPVVEFGSISHIIIEDDVPVYMPERCIKMWCDTLRVQGVGLMLLSKEKDYLRPLVYVKNPESLVWESSCASGTTAVGAYFAEKANGPVSMKIKEPGGTLTVEAEPGGVIKLHGKVEF